MSTCLSDWATPFDRPPGNYIVRYEASTRLYGVRRRIDQDICAPDFNPDLGEWIIAPTLSSNEASVKCAELNGMPRPMWLHPHKLSGALRTP